MTEWEEDCMRYIGHVLTGKKAHWCRDWDLLPVDETQPEFESCQCFAPEPEASGPITVWGPCVSFAQFKKNALASVEPRAARPEPLGDT